MSRKTARRFHSALSLVGLALCALAAADAPKTIQKKETFDRDPGWHGSHNRVVPKEYPTVAQDFGFSATNFAGKQAGEMGGKITRASEPAFYAEKIDPKTLDDKLSASGTFAITKTTPGGGVFFGFFNAQQPGGGGRPISSLGLHFDSEHSGSRLAVRLITQQNQSCGTFITPFIPGKFRPTPLRNDGTHYDWTLDYDPAGAGGRGQFRFTIRGDAPKPQEYEQAGLPPAHLEEARKRFPINTQFAVDLPEGYKQQNAKFDHFGIMNMMKAGGSTTIYFDDLTLNGQREDFSSDPKWYEWGNRASYLARDVGGAHNFSFSGQTAHAGGEPGEVGGVFWRGDEWGYYADDVGPLTFENRLEARGKVVLAAGAPDADMCFGWFHGDTSKPSPKEIGPFIGIKVGGPTRVGHYFLPTFTIDEKVHGLPNQGPILRPAKVYDWSLVYDPAAGGGNGAITATLGEESATLALKPGQKAKAKSAVLDRFGLFSIGPGGQIVKLYLDDIEYTAMAKHQ
jgi:hypothetical protein